MSLASYAYVRETDVLSVYVRALNVDQLLITSYRDTRIIVPDIKAEEDQSVPLLFDLSLQNKFETLFIWICLCGPKVL